MKLTCPECGRLIAIRKNVFGDLIYASHNLTTLAQVKEEGEVNLLAWADNDIACPMSGQVVELEEVK